MEFNFSYLRKCMKQCELDKVMVDRVVQSCFDLYNKLPKSGKPIEKEWTVLSCFIKHDDRYQPNIEIVSLGTGSKCIGATKMSPIGDLLNDSHAEVIARRGFLIYLYDNISKTMNGEPSIFNNQNGQLKLKDNISFIFYSSQLPCGDASILEKGGEQELYGDVLKGQKRPVSQDNDETEIKKQKLDNDIYRTGAKCLPHCEQDPKEAGSDYHLLGQVRTKPGRGDRTLSVSCSDKIAKWIHVGVQGSLIDMICSPIHVRHFIFGGGVPYSQQSVYRALLTRPSEYLVELNVIPEFYQSSLVFRNVRNNDNIRPAPGSIVWVKLSNELVEVAVQGRKLGLTKKKAILPGSSLCISKYNLYKRFINILNMNPSLRKKICDEDDIEKIPYNVMKRKSARYIKMWEEVQNKFFKTWTVKPDIWDFSISGP